MDNTQNAFLHLLRAGLWCQDVKLLSFNPVSFNNIYRLAEEHSVVGLITAGLEHVVDISISKEYSLQFIGNALQLEQRNILMNAFIREIIGGMRKKDIYVVLVKGQGVAQCYERPLWRASGDVDLILNETNYNTAKDYYILWLKYKKLNETKKEGFEVRSFYRCELQRDLDKLKE